MKIIFTIDSLLIGGTEKSTLDILTHFSKKTEYKVIYFYPNFDLKESFEKAGIPILYIPLKNKKLWKISCKNYVNFALKSCKKLRKNAWKNAYKSCEKNAKVV